MHPLASRRGASARHFRLDELSLALSLALALPVAAQADTALREVAVAEQAYSDTTVVVTAAALEAKAARDTRETFQNETGVGVGGGGNAIAQKIYVREIEDTLLTVTLDGVPQGGNIFHHQGRILINPELLKQVEIDKGGTVASVGPGGLAGSVRMTTKDAADLLAPGQSIGGMLTGGSASNNGWHGGGAVYGEAGKGFDYLLHAERTETGNYEDGNGVKQRNTASTQDSQLARFNWRPSPGHELSLGYQGLEDAGTRYPRPHMVGFTGSNTPMPQTLRQDTLIAAYRFAGRDSMPALDVDLFSDQAESLRTNAGAAAVFGKAPGYTFGERLESNGFNLLLKSKVGASTLRYGFNHHHKESEAINPLKTGINGNTSHEKSDVDGVFAEGSLPLAASLLLGLGGRYDRYSLTDNHGQTFDSDGFSPNASLTWLASDALSLRLGASRTVRGAGLKEAFMLDNGPGPNIYRNAADLKEEKASNVELGFNFDQGPWSAKGSVFRMTIDDYIGFVFAPPVVARDNVGKVKSSGYELGGSWKAGALRLGLSLSDAKPRLNGADLGDGDFSLGVSTGRGWLASADYALPAWHVDLGWNARVVEKVSYTPSGATASVTKAGYAVHDIRASWKPKGNEGWRATLSVRNLFDKFYYDQASYGFNAGQGMVLGYAEPGRDVRLDLTWKF